jgi:hypothetical protein
VRHDLLNYIYRVCSDSRAHVNGRRCSALH